MVRFADSPRSGGIDYLPPHRWAKLVIPSDDAPDPWRVTVDRAVRACPQG